MSKPQFRVIEPSDSPHPRDIARQLIKERERCKVRPDYLTRPTRNGVLTQKIIDTYEGDTYDRWAMQIGRVARFHRASLMAWLIRWFRK